MSRARCDHLGVVLVRLEDGTFRCAECGARVRFEGTAAHEVLELLGLEPAPA